MLEQIAAVAFGEPLIAISAAAVIAIAAVASVGISLASSLGAFGSGEFEQGRFPGIDDSAAASAADVELQAAQRRGDQRRSILAGKDLDDEFSIGAPTVLGAGDDQPQQPQTTFLGN